MENENKVLSTADNPEIVEPESVQGEVSTETNASVESKQEEKRCPNCQALLGEGQTFCSECGTPLKKLCQKCGAELQEGQAFCAKCGQRVDGTIDSNTTSAINQFNTNVAAQQQKKKRTPIIIAGICVVVAVIIAYFSLGQTPLTDIELAAVVAVEELNDGLKDPSSMQIHELHWETNENTDAGTYIIYIDYSAKNGFGGTVRNKARIYKDIIWTDSNLNSSDSLEKVMSQIVSDGYDRSEANQIDVKKVMKEYEKNK